MNKLYRFLSIFCVIPFLVVACSAQSVEASPGQQSTPAVASYELLLSKSLSDAEIVDFVTSNNCFSSNQYQLCKDKGVALWADSNQTVRTVYLYSGNADGFKRYQGKMPYKISFYDPMWKVEEKLNDLNVNDDSQPNQRTGFPDEAGSPDHIHYWTVYKQLRLTVIYDSPGADPDAYIYAVLVNE